MSNKTTKKMKMKMKIKEEERNSIEESEKLIELTGSFSILPMEIFMDILSRLPIRSLYGFILVSKVWFFIIRQSSFAQLHMTRSIGNKNPHSVMFLDKLNQEYYFVDHQVFDEFETTATFYKPRIKYDRRMVDIDSCNGLVSTLKRPFYISNPITGEYIKLPEPPFWRKHVVSVSGFGFSSVTNEYKVIRVLIRRSPIPYTDVQIYTIGSGEWRSVFDVPYTFIDPQWTMHENVFCCTRFTKPSVFLNGGLHWMGYENEVFLAPEVIIAFKIGTEEFVQIPLPAELSKQNNKILKYLLVLGDCLCLVHQVSDEHIEIWVMKEYGEQSSWAKEYVVSNIEMDYDVGGPYEPIQLMKNGDILLLCARRYLGYYDPIKEIYRPIDIDGIDSWRYALQPLVHVGSLISPRSIEGVTKSDNKDEDNNEEEDFYAGYYHDNNGAINDDDDGDSPDEDMVEVVSPRRLR